MILSLDGLPDGVKSIMPECIMFSRGAKPVSPRVTICSLDVFAGTEWVYKAASIEMRGDNWTMCDDRRAYNQLAELARLDFADRGFAAIIPECEIFVQNALMSIFRRANVSKERGAVVQYGVAPRELNQSFIVQSIGSIARMIDIAAEAVRKGQKS